MKKELVEYLSQFVTENKKQKIDEVLEKRTRHLTIAIEDIYQPQNASAVVRTCDCFGIQDIHIIENLNRYKLNPDVTLGSSKWIDIVKYNKKNQNNTLACIEKLKNNGYQIIATTPHYEEVFLNDLQLDKKIALFFGNEKEGLSKDVIEKADGFMKIPMTGFTESLNISVCAAISIHHLITKLWKSEINWKLSDEEKFEIKYKWIKKIIKRSDLLEKEFLMKSK